MIKNENNEKYRKQKIRIRKAKENYLDQIYDEIENSISDGYTYTVYQLIWNYFKECMISNVIRARKGNMLLENIRIKRWLENV